MTKCPHHLELPGLQEVQKIFLFFTFVCVKTLVLASHLFIFSPTVSCDTSCFLVVQLDEFAFSTSMMSITLSCIEPTQFCNSILNPCERFVGFCFLFGRRPMPRKDGSRWKEGSRYYVGAPSSVKWARQWKFTTSWFPTREVHQDHHQSKSKPSSI